jgi:hypothetical protein
MAIFQSRSQYIQHYPKNPLFILKANLAFLRVDINIHLGRIQVDRQDNYRVFRESKRP